LGILSANLFRAFRPQDHYHQSTTQTAGIGLPATYIDHTL